MTTSTFDVWHDLAENHPELSDALVCGTTVAAWYAMPDFIKSAPVRFLGKAALLTGIGSYLYHLPGAAEALETSGRELREQWENSQFGDFSRGAQMATLGAVAVSALWINAQAERYLMHRGDRKKAAGKRLAHLKQGILFGTLAGASVYYLQRRK